MPTATTLSVKVDDPNWIEPSLGDLITTQGVKESLPSKGPIQLGSSTQAAVAGWTAIPVARRYNRQGIMKLYSQRLLIWVYLHSGVG
jgi:hypothetical protein